MSARGRSATGSLALLAAVLADAPAAGPAPAVAGSSGATAGAEVPGSDPPTRSWIDDWDLPGMKAVYVRNLSDRPVQVTSFRLSDCWNVGLVECEVDTRVDRVIAPGDTIALVVVSPVLTASRVAPEASFRYRYDIRFR